MSKKSFTAAILVMIFLYVAGCGDQGTAGSPENGSSRDHTICDGTQDLRFAARIEGGDVVPVMLRALGSSYLYVRGDCTYWSNFSVAWFRPTRSGKLTPTEAEQLASDFAYGEWETLAEYYAPLGPSHTSLVLYDGQKRIQCMGDSCVDYGPYMDVAPINRFWSSFQAWKKRLDEEGPVFQGNMRAVVVSIVDEASIVDLRMRMLLLTWPYEWPLDSMSTDFEGDGVLVAGAEADELRTLRSMYAVSNGILPPGASAGPGWFTLQAEGDDRTLYELWFRDSIPLEDDRGQIPFVVADGAP